MTGIVALYSHYDGAISRAHLGLYIRRVDGQKDRGVTSERLKHLQYVSILVSEAALYSDITEGLCGGRGSDSPIGGR